MTTAVPPFAGLQASTSTSHKPRARYRSVRLEWDVAQCSVRQPAGC
jgi:hypothetical protein